MKKLFGRLVMAVVVVLAIRYVGDFILNYRLMHHFNECHTELRIENRFKVTYGREKEALWREYAECAKRKGTFVDRYFKSAMVDEVIEAMKIENARGPSDGSDD